MSRAPRNWERLVRATLRREQQRSAGLGPGRAATGPSGVHYEVPPSLVKSTNINAILQAADEIQGEDPNIARILCEQAYTMAQELDPSSEGRGVLQFKTGLMSVIKQKLAKKEGTRIDRNHDIKRLWEFYQDFKRRHRVDDIQEEQQRWRESGTFSTTLGDMELRSVQMKKVYATLRALIEVLEALTRDLPADGLSRLIKEEVAKMKKSGELVPYNIVPIDAPSVTEAIGYFPEVMAAISAISYCAEFPRLPADFEVSQLKNLDLFDLLQYVFGFQKDNIRNQRENVVLALANAQSRLGIPMEGEPKIDEKAINEVFVKVLDNYIKWCRYLGERIAWNRFEAINRNRKLILVSLYFLTWGEAANVRFLPECICYIFHNMAKELDVILDHSEARPAASCTGGGGEVSYLQEIIRPIYETMAAEAARNNNGKAAHSAWRNYDDFNEYFWKVLDEKNSHSSDSTYFQIYLLVLGIYAGIRVFFAMLIKFPACHALSNISDRWPFFQFFKWIYQIYIMDIHIWYTLLSAIVGGFMGARARLGEIRSIEMVHKRFESFPEAFVKNLVSFKKNRLTYERQPSQILLAIDLALDCKDTQQDLWNRISKDEYMAYAVQECYYSAEKILHSLVDDEGRLWVERLFREINNSIASGSLVVSLNLKKLQLVLSRFTALTGLLVRDETPELKVGVSKAISDLYDVVTHELLSQNLREQFDTWHILARARYERRLFSRIEWPKEPEIKEQVKRLHLLLTVKDSAANTPKNLEARRRLQFFTNSLFMNMPPARPVSEMMPFSVFTPYYSETVLYSLSELRVENEDGISTLFYLQKIFPDEWENFLERTGSGESTVDPIQGGSRDALELRFWASYRGQTLARTGSLFHQLPGDPKLGEGKPENQNHAIIFTRGDAIQTIDMNQDNYLEEAMKMRNLLEEFCGNHGLRPPTILGVREHVFTGRVRMHYGHPDVFDRIFHITRGGISKASRVINISEDIYAGFNSTLRQGNITHHEYIQVGKGRDVGLNQIALFEVGFYVCTMMTVLTIYIFLYGRAYLALSGLDESIEKQAEISGNAALDAALNAQFLVQIGVFTAVPMIMGFILELGLLKAVVSFVTMQLQLCSVFFTFSLGTRTHYFGRTILHGGAKYKATGRGFVVRHIKFSENYRIYSRSHFVKALEVALLLIVYLAYGYTKGGAMAYVLVTISSWFLVLSWLFAPYIFNPSGFEWQKTVEDFDDWTSWLLYKGGVGMKGENSWESWWDEEQVFTFSPKKTANCQLAMRFIQGVTSIALIAALVLFVALTDLSIPDLFASALAFIATGWAILCLSITWKRLVKTLGLWDSVREIARMYDAGMGMLIFTPIAILSWFPFVSTFQSRLLFNQAFSRGLEISLILAGNKANVQI
ncbi:Callose synthase 10 [Acorus calamus]|uniref:1,3-beta-glucan synthase n=1 Tax=Acorus calamus TaxID=4465 RepID=A0AAV9CF50_ACOCL|nr:Callose synthase 10 [Acorus calamus]